MGWSSLSFPFGSLLTAAKMTQVYSNFASAMMQESGSPPPSGVWSFQGQVRVGSDFYVPGSSEYGYISVVSGVSAPGVSSFGSLAVSSGVSAPGVSSFDQLNVNPASGQSSLKLASNSAMQLMQSVFVQRTAADVNSTQTFSTFLVASLTPFFGDSLIRVRGSFNSEITALGSAPSDGRANLCRAPNGTPVVLTDSSANQFGMGTFGRSPAAGTADIGEISFQYQEASPGSGIATQYGIRYAPLFIAGSSSVTTIRGDLLVEEWR